MQTPLVSILIPARAAEPYIVRAVQSALAQSYRHLEVLVIADDDGDYAGLLQAALGDSEPRLRCLYTGGDTGPSAARNLGLQAARGEVIAPLDADDRFHPDRLARLLPHLRDGAVTDNRRVIDDTRGAPLGVVMPVSDDIHRLDAAAFLAILTPLGLVARREHFAHGWDEDLRFAEDTLANLKVLESAGGLSLLGQPLHDYHVHHRSACHGEDGASRAAAAYARCLAQLDAGTSGLATPAVRSAWRQALRQRARMNAVFASGVWPDYQRYLLATGRLAAPPRATTAEPAATYHATHCLAGESHRCRTPTD